MNILIIGAVAGGASAAARARRLSEDANIILIERSEAPSFANCGLPYYIGGVIENSRASKSTGKAGGSHANFLLDVRSPAEFAAGHVPGAVNIPIEELRNRLDELPRDRPIAAYCKVGQRGYLATRLLAQRGYQVRNLSGGFTTFQAVESANNTV